MPGLQHVLSEQALVNITQEQTINYVPRFLRTVVFSISSEVLYSLLELQAKISGCQPQLPLAHLPVSNLDTAHQSGSCFHVNSAAKMLNKHSD